MPAKNLLLMDADIKRPGRKKLQILWTSFMDGPNTLKGWNELLDYLQTNNAFRKSKLINYNFDNSTLFPPLSTIQQGVLDYLNEFIALQSVRDEYYKELSKPYSPPIIFWGYLKINCSRFGVSCNIISVYL